jgi:uncharacterized protein (DUF1015 family)
MADLRPFSALRPPASLVAEVACPPYDVISTAEARALAAGNTVSYLQVTRPEISLPEGTDEHDDAVYGAGRKNLLRFVEQGVLVRDPEPHLYVYAQRWGAHEQVGIVGCAAVADYRAGRIKIHEKTRPDKEDDRARHIAELEAHDEPVFLAFPAHAAVDASIAQVMDAGPPVYDFEAQNVRHRLWIVEANASRTLSAVFAENVPAMYVADGHHRSAAAARVHADRKGDGAEHDVFLVVAFPHDRLQILPYNRVVRAEGKSADDILGALRKKMDVVATDRPEPEVPGSFGVYAGGRWYRATAMPGSFDAADPVASLDCQICQDQILGPIFGIVDPRRDQRIDFVGGIHGPAELARRVDAGGATAAIQLYPTQMEQVMAVSDAGLTMPPKSTWFEPKLRSGLFAHTF